MTLRRVLARVPADEADDLLQQTALAVIEKMETFDPTKGNFMQWVKQILWHKRMDMHRRRVARRTTPVTDLSDEAHHGFDSTADGSPDSADVLVVREEYERVNREIENLRWPVRLAIRMVYDERLTYDEAAAILQTTSAALRVAVSRALHQIRTRLAA
jgi:RNA polymerase sigma-70 factor (ECF subfamily)